jgi:hypothetical protein
VPDVDARTIVAAREQPPAPPTDGHTEFAVPVDVARDAAAIMDAAIVDAALTEPQRAMLEFERQWWQRGGAKEQAIRDTFGMTPIRYYQALNGVLGLPAAMRYDAMLVSRLLRIRGQAARGRRSPG